jgi:hypothetical protein
MKDMSIHVAHFFRADATSSSFSRYNKEVYDAFYAVCKPKLVTLLRQDQAQLIAMPYRLPTRFSRHCRSWDAWDSDMASDSSHPEASPNIFTHTIMLG